MLAEGAAIAWVSLASTYAVAGIAAFPGVLPAARQAATLGEAGFVGVAFTLAFMVFCFRPARCHHGAGVRWPRLDSCRPG